MRFIQTKLFPLLLGTSCLLTSAVSIQSQKTAGWEYFWAPAQPDIAVKGQHVEGTEITVVEGGRSLKFKIAQVELDPQDPEQETYLYTILFQNAGSPQWQNFCQPDRNNVAKAIPLSGSWDDKGNHYENSRITFACTHGVLAKCVRFGYKPWKTVQGRSLRDFHQACTRMVRADYCGNGRAHTKEGTAIDIYDRLRIQTRTPKSGMVFEAAWSPEGAVFIDRTRWPESLAQIEKECPERLKSPANKSITSMNIQQQTSDVLLVNDSFDTNNMQAKEK
jgi:ADYC domain